MIQGFTSGNGDVIREKEPDENESDSGDSSGGMMGGFMPGPVGAAVGSAVEKTAQNTVQQEPQTTTQDTADKRSDEPTGDGSFNFEDIDTVTDESKAGKWASRDDVTHISPEEAATEARSNSLETGEMSVPDELQGMDIPWNDPRVNLQDGSVVVEMGEWQGESGDVRGRVDVPYQNVTGGKVVDGDFKSRSELIQGRIQDALQGTRNYTSLGPVGEGDSGVPEAPEVSDRDYSYMWEDWGGHDTVSGEPVGSGDGGESSPEPDPPSGGGDGGQDEPYRSKLPPEIAGRIGQARGGGGGDSSLVKLAGVVGAVGVGAYLIGGAS